MVELNADVIVMITTRWLDEIVTGLVSDAEHLVKRERCTIHQVNLTLSLAFLAPQLVLGGEARQAMPG